MNKHNNKNIRVMTYNVHSCRGLDWRTMPIRIGQIIETYNPDIVALQELDVNRRNSGNMDQPLIIADYLRMQCHFQPAIAVEGENYGIAILSKFPLEIIKANHLERCKSSIRKATCFPFMKYLYETREIIWAEVTVGNQRINVFNTHLGLRAEERKVQIQDILSKNWIGAIEDDAPIIFCGDFNSGSNSSVYKTIQTQLHEVKMSLNETKTRKTFFSTFPLLELDHIFYKGNITLKSSLIPITNKTRVASDHLPLIADFEIQQ